MSDHPPTVLCSSKQQKGSRAQVLENSGGKKFIWLEGWWESSCQVGQVGRTGTDSSWMLRDGLVVACAGTGTETWALLLLCWVPVFSKLKFSASLMRNLYIRYVRQIWTPMFCPDTKTHWIDTITPVRDKLGSWFSDDSVNLLFICPHNWKPGPFVNDILKSPTFSQGDHQLLAGNFWKNQ